MTDTVQPIAPVTSAPIVEAAPVTPVTAPTVTVEAPITVTPTPTAPVVETPVTALPTASESPSTTPAPTETLIAEAIDTKTKEDSAKAAEEAAKTEPPKTDGEPAKTNESGDQSEEPAPSPVYEAFKLPENVTLDAERMGEFTKLLSGLETEGKLPHELAQKFGQEAVDFHISELQKTVTDYQKLIVDSWQKQKVEWKDAFLADPELGGNRWQTTVTSALDFIRTHGGSPEQQTEFRNIMETSGLGNHPAMIRLLANAGRAMQEGKPLAATAPIAPPKSKTATLYGKSS